MTDEEIIERIRFLLGGIDEDTLPDAIISYIITTCDETTDCEIIYCVLLQCLLYLIRQAAKDNASGGGNVIKREEQRGSTKIRVDYSDNADSSTEDLWREMYDDYLAHPEYVCESLVEGIAKNGTFIYIGGVSKAKSEAVKDNPDSLGSKFGIGWLDDL